MNTLNPKHNKSLYPNDIEENEKFVAQYEDENDVNYDEDPYDFEEDLDENDLDDDLIEKYDENDRDIDRYATD